MKTLVGKTVILTGASGGIGAFLARALAKEGATVVGISRSKESLDQICAEVNKLGGKGISIPFDLSQIETISKLVENIHNLAGPVDILINNAAIEKYRPFQNYTFEDIQLILTTNLLAPMELTRLILLNMIERNSGHIVNISSLAGKKGTPYNSIYSASKAGLIMWSDAIQQELVNTNVKVSVVCPGITDAGMFHAVDMPPPKGTRVAHPTEVAEAIIRSIRENQKEVILEGVAPKVMLAISQFFPQFGDAIYRQVGVVKLNHSCAQKQMQAETNLQN